ncbi:deoxyguanosinetriphosphate triphosphohydrolase family protein [Thomasclavelia cocleata]|mgnify:FL=1|jgi:dGTPase|uniref:deoxyguanosinetriphosphate triphosphohydrolase family protein n=1 Tax=Thomasclavelia cocleata TaxID=69824 RepID=UPI00241F517F|nr:HD domain-containing protein [Thomasclavelia cocleata]MCI9630190.1 HD domain-containing protein [Thomasclavelia cocleata]
MKKEELVIKNTLQMTKETDEHLSIYATKNSDCIKIKQTIKDKEEFDIRWPFEEDIDRILYCKSYQRYVDKTQALSFFRNAHISKRSIHVQWVSRIARQIGRGLNLNLDLIEAAALGHDLGHAPYGHVGEKALNEILQAKGYGYFAHNANSVRNILFLERNGIGYNVSLQVLDAILCHNGEMLSKKYIPDTNKTINQFWREYDDCWHKENTSKKILPMTLEGCVVRISDVISYIGKDVEDAIRVGIIKQSDLPKEVTDILGFNNKSMINRLIGDLVIHSYELPYLQFSNEVFESLKCLLNFLTIKVHQHPVLVKENAKLIRMIKQLYDIYYEELTDLENENCKIKTFVAKMSSTYQSNDPALIVADYLSMMTDSYVLAEYESIFLPIQHNEII